MYKIAATEWLNDNFQGIGKMNAASSQSLALDEADSQDDELLVIDATEEAARTDAILGPFADATYVGRYEPNYIYSC